MIAKHLVIGNGPEWSIFSPRSAEFVSGRTFAAARSPGVRVDPDSGDVWVNGEKIPTLTNLEYRLLLLLYGRIGKIVTKYEVVEAVWGEDYIDDVDDARIEKLVSRLRQKNRARSGQSEAPAHSARPRIQARRSRKRSQSADVVRILSAPVMCRPGRAELS